MSAANPVPAYTTPVPGDPEGADRFARGQAAVGPAGSVPVGDVAIGPRHPYVAGAGPGHGIEVVAGARVLVDVTGGAVVPDHAAGIPHEPEVVDARPPRGPS